jgi:hypothetical protein
MSSEIITIYIPIFREKLARLEALGRGDTKEAAGLRRAIAQADGPQRVVSETNIPVAA